MPHDKNGAEVKPGDKVTMEFEVKDVQTGTEYCNATLVSVEKMFPGEHKTSLTVNTKQVVKAAVMLFILSAVLALQTGVARAADPFAIADAEYAVLPFGHTTFIRYQLSDGTTGKATGILSVPKGAKVLGTVEYPGIWVANEPVKAEPPAIAKKGCTCAVGCRCYEGKPCECLSPCPCEDTGPCAGKRGVKAKGGVVDANKAVLKGEKVVLCIGVPCIDGAYACGSIKGYTDGVYDCHRNYTVNMMQIRTSPVSDCAGGKCYPASAFGFANPKTAFDAPSCTTGNCPGTTTVRRR